ncbi:MAG: pyrroline-5-carboxylate reductase [Chlamydiota bacterium]
MKILVIGSGNMGSVFIRYLSKKHSVIVCDRGSGKGEALASEVGATYVQDVQKAVEGVDIIILAVKPKDYEDLASKLTSFLPATCYVISLLVGVSIARLKKAFPETDVIRLMPNTAISVSQGILGFSGGNLSLEERTLMESIFSSLGLVFWILESKMEAFAALAASSPAFIFVLLESMIDSGLHIGFSVEESRKIVLQVLEGCVTLLRETDLSLQELKWQISSPGGTTIAGLKALEESAFRAGIWNAIEATYQKSLSLE